MAKGLNRTEFREKSLLEALWGLTLSKLTFEFISL